MRQSSHPATDALMAVVMAVVMSVMVNKMPTNRELHSTTMICKACLYFDPACCQRPGDMPDSDYGFCRAGDTPLERAQMLSNTATCRWQQPRFHARHD
jgi:hypothetical protein